MSLLTLTYRLLLGFGLSLLLYQETPSSAQTAEQLKYSIVELVDRGNYPEAFEQLSWLIPLLEDPKERETYLQYKEQLMTFYAGLSELEKIQLEMVGAGRELAKMHMGGEARYQAAIAGGIPTDNTDSLASVCEQELQQKMDFPYPLRLTSKPWVIAIDEGIYNISGIISGPEWGEVTIRWRYHCLVRHDSQGIHILRANAWL
ncbi:MAG: hypothetical protein AB4040_05805 [Synechococcus sp.]